MTRVEKLQLFIHETLYESMTNPDQFSKWIAHLHGVALAAAMFAKKRGEDPEVAAMAGLLHDVYAYKIGTYEDHAHRGADYARIVLEEMNVASEEEIALIYSAIYHHDDDDMNGSAMDEILKDADMIHHALGDPSKEWYAKKLERYQRLCSEFGV